MKKTLPVIISFFLAGITHAQQTNFTKTPALGIHLAFFDIPGADSLRAFGKNMRPGLAIHYQNDISKQLNYSVHLAGSYLDFPDRKGESLGDGKKQLLVEVDWSVQAKLLPPGSLLNPYVHGGLGLSLYNGYFGLFIPAGLGCRVNLRPDLFILLNTQYRIPVTNTQHRHFYHGIGLAGVINKKRFNKKTPAVSAPPVVRIARPVDADGDGIVDSIDRCPTVIGVIRYNGCPPPDRDGDRINDEEDACPDVKGVVRYKGCPEPDADKDGIADALDKCPGLAGTAAHNGCPEIAEAVKTTLSKAARQVFFKTGSYILLPGSYPALEEVTGIMKNNPALHLYIEGHTDNTGTPEKNQLLSNNRAHAVLNYLQKMGIQSFRLHATGYGQQQPVADNGTSAGRAANRRVAFDVKY